jgi:hypothetical protein
MYLVYAIKAWSNSQLTARGTDLKLMLAHHRMIMNCHQLWSLPSCAIVAMMLESQALAIQSVVECLRHNKEDCRVLTLHGAYRRCQ